MKRPRAGPVLFAAVWLIVVAVPALRYVARVQLLGDREFLSPLSTAAGGFTVPALATSITGVHAGDVEVRAEAVEEDAGSRPDRFKHPELLDHEYDVLRRRYPTVPWLVAKRLRHTSRWLFDHRVAGELENVNPNTAAPAYSSWGPPQPAELHEAALAVTVAHRGVELEPNNGLFYWMEAYYLFLLGRDQEAMATLHQGAARTGFDSHIHDDLVARTGVRELTYRRRLSLEERLYLASAQQYTHPSLLRHAAHMAVWIATGAEAAGDHQKALSEYVDLMRLGATMRDGGPDGVETDLGVATLLMTWRSLKRRGSVAERRYVGTRFEVSPDTVLRRSCPLFATKFAGYAVAHGRPDLARLALRESQATLNCTTTRFFTLADVRYGIPGPILVLVLWLNYVATALLGLAVWILAQWLTIAVSVGRGTEQGDKTHARLIAVVVITSAASVSSVLVWAVWQGGGWINWYWSGDVGPTEFPGELIPLFLLPLLGATCLGAANALRIRNSPKAAAGDKPKLLSRIRSALPAARDVVANLALLALLLGTWRLDFNRHDAAPLLPIGFTACLPTIWLLQRYLLARGESRLTTKLALHLYARTLGGLLVLTSIAYLLIVLAGLAPRASAERHFQEYLQCGSLRCAQLHPGDYVGKRYPYQGVIP